MKPEIDLEKAIIVAKTPRFILDMNKYHFTEDELIAKYKQEGTDAEEALSSYNKQMESISFAKTIFDSRQFVAWGDLTRKQVKNTGLVITLGGDNHFSYVSHFISNELIIGINSDPRSVPGGSEGALTYFNMQSFKDFVRRLKTGEFMIEEWTRLEVILNGSKISTLGTNEILIGESRRKMMSRYAINYNGFEEPQKSSGVLVSTGAGSTGMYKSEGRYLFPEGNIFSKTERLARFLVTAPYQGKLTSYSLLEGELQGDQELLIKSQNDHEGEVSIDSLFDLPFPRGHQVRIKIADQPLRVVKPLL